MSSAESPSTGLGSSFPQTGDTNYSEEFQHLTNTINSLRAQISRLSALELDAVNKLGTPEARQHLDRLQQDRDAYELLLARAMHTRTQAVERMHKNNADDTTFQEDIEKLVQFDGSLPPEPEHAPATGSRFLDPFFILVGILQVAIMVLFWIFVDYDHAFNEEKHEGEENDVGRFYLFFTDVSFMLYIGFGFLMTFLRRYGFGSVGFTFLMSAFCVEWGLLCVGVAKLIASNGPYTSIHLNVAGMIDGDFAAAAFLISFGALIGKASPTQLIFMAFWEVVFYSFNFLVCQLKLGLVDIGGSLIIHTFGAFFGLSATIFMSPKVTDSTMHRHKASRYTSDMFAMIGTVFLWLLWPSFNAALAPPFSQPRAIMNTILSLVGSCVATFVWSQVLRGHKHRQVVGHFDMVDIQNATVAGGVAVGGAADLVLGPGGSLLLGLAAGTISTLGFCYVSPWVEKKFGLQDTCGILNLHGMPGVLGGIASAVVTGIARDDRYEEPVNEYFPQGEMQGRYQIYSILITLGMAISSGLLVGFVTSRLFKHAPKDNLFEDSQYWATPADYSYIGLQPVDLVIAERKGDHTNASQQEPDRDNNAPELNNDHTL
eukprot:TRINITY_DN5486_c0_g1_i2.p1 TRINITY_DN5486_c0_g1~~TRINITY_DN5486_c0_g1_i2.p1  ORF type:complete len:607 (-),score=150.24 TRINITY_DN5486_c0_g1_i2:13-1812(-)